MQVAKYNLKIKNIFVYLVLITLYFSGIGATGFREIIVKEEDKDAVETLVKDEFVDDLLGGEETRGDVDKQASGITRMLSRGGFKLKFVVNSGVEPCDKASSDWKTVKMLGY